MSTQTNCENGDIVTVFSGPGGAVGIEIHGRTSSARALLTQVDLRKIVEALQERIDDRPRCDCGKRRPLGQMKCDDCWKLDRARVGKT